MNAKSARLSLVMLTVLSVIGNSSWAQDDRIFTEQELMNDARQLASILEQSHPDPYTSGGGKIDFHRRFQELLEDIPAEGMNAEQFYELLLPFVASLRDGHTALLTPRTSTSAAPGLPLTFKIIDESLAVASVIRRDDTILRGALLLDVEGVPLQELVRRQNSLRGIENVYGTLALLTRSLRTERGLQRLLRGRADPATTRVTLRLADGETKEFLFEHGESTQYPHANPESGVLLPDMRQSDVAWSFLDEDGQTALLKIDDMSGYREASEAWIAEGMSEGMEMARAAYEKFNRQAAPQQVEDILAGIPSATDVFKDLVVAMKRAGTKLLIVDLRENTGGNDLMVPMLLYFLFGEESMVSYDRGYQISRYSELYFDVYANASLAGINHNREVPLKVGDYDFSEQRARSNGVDPTTLIGMAGEKLRDTPTFYKVFSEDLYGNYYRPPHLVALSSAWTYSSGFAMLAALEGFGATVIGTPSGHAGNNFGDSLLFQLTNTQLRGAVSFKQNVTFPDDPDKGRCLIPDIVLTHEKWAALNFDPNAEVLSALEFFRETEETNSAENRGYRGSKDPGSR
jgi:hypothetical protein